jgi:hypothetical protein
MDSLRPSTLAGIVADLTEFETTLTEAEAALRDMARHALVCNVGVEEAARLIVS